MSVEIGEAPRRLGLVVATSDQAEDLLAKVPELVQRAGDDDARLGVERGRGAQVAKGVGEIDSGGGKCLAARPLEAESAEPRRSVGP